MGKVTRLGSLTAVLIGALMAPARAETLGTAADGWIAGATGDIATFGVFGGIQSDGVIGSLEYIDHGVNLRVKSTSITSFTPGCTSTIEGSGESKAGPVFFIATMQDNDEPGTSDTFTIQVTGSVFYANAGILGGGNVQALQGVCS